jgi:hypothetical protein
MLCADMVVAAAGGLFLRLAQALSTRGVGVFVIWIPSSVRGLGDSQEFNWT